MNKKITLVAATILTAGMITVNANADNTIYAVDVLIGEANQRNGDLYVQTISGTDTSKAIRFTAQINRVIGIEVGYTDYGVARDTFTYSNGDTATDYLDSTALNVGMSGRIPIGDTVSLIGRVGLASWDLDYTEKDSAYPGDDYRDSDQGIDAYIGFGIRFELEKNFRVGVEYTGMAYSASIDSEDTDHVISNLALSAGFVF